MNSDLHFAKWESKGQVEEAGCLFFHVGFCNNNNNNNHNNDNDNNNNKGLICQGPSTFLLPQNLDMFVFEDGDHVFLENGRRDSFSVLAMYSK